MWWGQLGVTWAISATRVADNRHHVADVVAGMLLGGMTATVFALRAIPRVRCAGRACMPPERDTYPACPTAMLPMCHALSCLSCSVRW